MSSVKYHHGDLKTALITEAEKILEQRGIEALSLRTLAAAVGVSHMAPYAHFKNKTELFQAIAASGFDAMSARMEKIDASLSPEHKILNYGTAYIEFALANAPLYRLMLSQTQVTGPNKADTGSAHLSDELKRASKRPHDLLDNEFEKLIKDPLKRQVRTKGAWAMVHGMAALIIDGHMRVPEGMDIKTFLAQATLQSAKMSVLK